MPSAFDYASGANRRRSAAAAAAAARRSPQADLGLVPPVPAEIYEGDERYTRPEELAWCMAKAGVAAFDLDVAACGESHHAPLWFGIAEDGLRQPWDAKRVWCNPPYSEVGPWVEKAWHEWNEGRCATIAMLLPASRTEQPWWQEHVEPARDGRGSGNLFTHFLPGRARFGIPGNPLGVGVGSPPFGCVLLVWRAA